MLIIYEVGHSVMRYSFIWYNRTIMYYGTRGRACACVFVVTEAFLWQTHEHRPGWLL